MTVSVSVFVYLSASISLGTTRQIFVILCMLSWPWLSPPLAMRYVMYFRFYGYVILAHNGHISIVAGSDVIASSCAGYVPAA